MSVEQIAANMLRLERVIARRNTEQLQAYRDAARKLLEIYAEVPLLSADRLMKMAPILARLRTLAEREKP